MPHLREHDITLTDGALRLRPMTEADWDILLPWNNDPDVTYYSEGDEITSWSLADMRAMYRSVSERAWVFIAEVDGQPIGECWLQEMNMPRVLDRYPGLALRRIDLMIGDKARWGRGWGTRIIALLTRLGFERCTADAIFGVCVADYNPRSLRAFAKNGYRVDARYPCPPGGKHRVEHDLILTRQEWQERCREPGT